jgi:hypothetical protein
LMDLMGIWILGFPFHDDEIGGEEK